MTSFEVALVAVNERIGQQNEHNGAMTVKSFEMLKQLCRKQRDKNGSDLPEGIVLPVNSLESIQMMEAVMHDPNQVKHLLTIW